MRCLLKTAFLSTAILRALSNFRFIRAILAFTRAGIWWKSKKPEGSEAVQLGRWLQDTFGSRLAPNCWYQDSSLRNIFRKNVIQIRKLLHSFFCGGRMRAVQGLEDSPRFPLGNARPDSLWACHLLLGCSFSAKLGYPRYASGCVSLRRLPSTLQLEPARSIQ